MQVSENPSPRNLGVFVMTLSGLALGGPLLLAFLAWGLDLVGPLVLVNPEYGFPIETSANLLPVFVGAYILAFSAAFGWGFTLMRKGSRRT
jgi:hypothetical protein